MAGLVLDTNALLLVATGGKIKSAASEAILKAGSEQRLF
jgi:hypothetical protein